MDEINTIGLVGYPVNHSKSPEIFHKFFQAENLLNWQYVLFPKETLIDIHQWIHSDVTLRGFNVTIPHKQTIIPFLDYLDDKSQAIGAVNTVIIQRIGGSVKLLGTNTDFDGFKISLDQFETTPTQAFIFGDGGSAKAVKSVFSSLNIHYYTVSRTKSSSTLSYSEFFNHPISEGTLFVQTTPLGMWPNIEEMIPFPSKELPKNCMAIDLVYNPKETLFLKTLSSLGAQCLNGETMLNEQAKSAWNYFKTNEI